MGKKGRPIGSFKGDSKQGVVRFRCDLAEKSRWVKLAQKEGKTLTEWIVKKLNKS